MGHVTVPLRERLVAANVASLACSAPFPRFGVALTRGTSSVWSHLRSVYWKNEPGENNAFVDSVDLTLIPSRLMYLIRKTKPLCRKRPWTVRSGGFLQGRMTLPVKWFDMQTDSINRSRDNDGNERRGIFNYYN